MQFLYKMHVAGKEKLLAICDKNILGKTFEEKDLNITVSEEFYSGKGCDEKAAVKLMEDATIINAVGREIIGLMIRKSIVSEDNVLYISSVPHAQAVSA